MAYDGFFYKQPNEIKPFDVDFADSIDPDAEGVVTISSAVIVVYDSDGNNVSTTILNGGYTITTGKNSTNTKIIQQVKAGTDGEKYNIEVLATASDGSKPEFDIELRIKKKGTN